MHGTILVKFWIFILNMKKNFFAIGQILLIILFSLLTLTHYFSGYDLAGAAFNGDPNEYTYETPYPYQTPYSYQTPYTYQYEYEYQTPYTYETPYNYQTPSYTYEYQYQQPSAPVSPIPVYGTPSGPQIAPGGWGCYQNSDCRPNPTGTATCCNTGGGLFTEGSHVCASTAGGPYCYSYQTPGYTYPTPNTAPLAPSISGPTSGNPSVPYSYAFLGTDPDSDTIKYGIDWSTPLDGVADEWLPASSFTNSGNTLFTSHSWSSIGAKLIRALTVDFYGNGSPWSSTFTVNIANTLTNNATFISQTVPIRMNPGGSYPVTITMRNSGTTTWVNTANYGLGTQNPIDNNNFYPGRVYLPVASVSPGSNYTFSFNVTAPTTPGVYNFQNRMVQDGVEWFGDFTPNVPVNVNLVPIPVNFSLTCSPSGTTVTASWNNPPGYNTYFIRANPSPNFFTFPSTIIEQNWVGTSYSFASTPGETYYFWMHTKESDTQFSPGVDGYVTCTNTAIAGSCGTANGRAFLSTDTGYSPYTQCSAGVSNNTNFPSLGVPVSWTCSGQNGGAPSPTCSASMTSAAVPNSPNISGPTTGQTGTTYTYTFNGTDPDSNPVRYGIDWSTPSDGVADEWLPSSGYVSSGTSLNSGHSWSTTGIKDIRALTQNNIGNNSPWSPVFNVSISSIAANSAPTAPTISGPTTGQPSTSYGFLFNATDPDGDQIRYGIDWSTPPNASVDEWVPASGYVNSGLSQGASNSWSTTGIKSVQVLAQDENGNDSSWASHSIDIDNVITPVNGSCGGRAGGLVGSRNYPSAQTTWDVGDTYCSSGNQNSCSPAGCPFPAAGGTTTWSCDGINGGAPASCLASRQAATTNIAVNVITAGGSVSSSPAGINNCTGYCSSSFPLNSLVTLTATPSSSYWKFSSWGGDCASFGSSRFCTLTADSSKNVTAQFVPRIFDYSEF